ncbi:MAG: HD domain-containing protein [Candidatus Hydrothermarchaeota archaeon]
MLSREDSLRLIEENIKNEALKKHMLAVSAIMKGLARKLHQNEELYERVGLLHDIDYERVGGNMNVHGKVSAEMLEDKLPEECLHAIRAHNELTGAKPESLMDKSLIIADAISGLIVAVALVMPSKKLSEVKVKSIKKKFKDKSFARNVDRNKIMMCEEIGLEYEEFLDIALKSLQEISSDLGL